MGIISFDPRLSLQTNSNHHNYLVTEEIEGIIKVFKNGQIERPLIVPNVACVVPSELGVTSKDVILYRPTNLWARFYLPVNQFKKNPFLVYFHGGGFCVGSADWKCYHDFLARLSSKANCVIMSINYHLAPEHRLPKAYEDGCKAIMWAKEQALSATNEHKWWLNQCNFSNTFLVGDSAGANIAHNVSIRLCQNNLSPLCLKGNILIQPFFGGETRTYSEKHATQPINSALTLSSSDTYWRLSLPIGANRDHPWCNPLGKGAPKLSNFLIPAMMVCISEMDILKDRDLEYCVAMANCGVKVEKVVYRGVGHAFQVLSSSQLSQTRINEMMTHLKAFINQ